MSYFILHHQIICKTKEDCFNYFIASCILLLTVSRMYLFLDKLQILFFFVSVFFISLFLFSSLLFFRCNFCDYASSFIRLLEKHQKKENHEPKEWIWPFLKFEHLTIMSNKFYWLPWSIEINLKLLVIVSYFAEKHILLFQFQFNLRRLYLIGENLVIFFSVLPLCN